MLKLATLIENPGEPGVRTRYHDPHELRRLGYNGLVIYETTALSGVQSADLIATGELRRWVGSQFDHVAAAVESARGAGLSVYLCYDALVLARDLVQRNHAGLTCRNRSAMLCPASEPALDLSTSALEAMLQRWPDVEGVVLRLGDTDAERLPHLSGNDIYSPRCPRCGGAGPADRILALIASFHRLVVAQMGRRLIVRAWNVRPGGLHDSPDLAKRVMAGLPRAAPGAESDDRLIFSFKFTQTDFWRYQKWNQSSLAFGDRPILYELQCQREFEGKGGVPDWQPPLWRDGHPEMEGPDPVAGLAQAARRVNLAGLWAWVRGGGWGGPFVKDETWIDANVFAVPRLAERPDADPDDLARRWIGQRLNVAKPAVAEELLNVLKASPRICLNLFYIGPFARLTTDPWGRGGGWIRDDLLDAAALWRIVQQLSREQLETVVAEKEEAAGRLGRHRTALQHLVSDRQHVSLEPLVNTLVYSESLAQTLRDLLTGLAAWRRSQQHKGRPTHDIVRQKLFAAQTHWNHHTQRHGSLPGAATAFRESGFWELTEQTLAEVG